MTDSPLKIAVVLGSTRPGRKGAAVAEWVLQCAKQQQGATFDLVDVADYNLSLLGEATVPAAANRQYESEQTRAWSAKIDEYDAYVWVSPEYNHGVPAAMKNALDVLGPEWNHKGFGLVTYGADGGVRAAEHWRVIIANLMGVVVRHQVSLSTFIDWDGDAFQPLERREGELENMLGLLIQTSNQIKQLRK